MSPFDISATSIGPETDSISIEAFRFNDVKSTNDKVEDIDEKVGETIVKIAAIKTAVSAQKTQCAATIKRFDRTIGDQNKELIRLSGRER